MTDQLLLVFVKNPVLGQVKTRLAQTMGAEAALEIYQVLLEHTQKVCKQLPVDVAVFYSQEVDHHDSWDVPHKQLQLGDDLGQRMSHAFKWAFDQGYKRVCIIGSDCFQLGVSHIEEAFTALEQYPIALGPTLDGGYYLLGMKLHHPQLFRNKAWSTDQVMQQTLRDVNNLSLSAYQLQQLSDVDREEDLTPELLKVIAQ